MAKTSSRSMRKARSISTEGSTRCTSTRKSTKKCQNTQVAITTQPNESTTKTPSKIPQKCQVKYHKKEHNMSAKKQRGTQQIVSLEM